MNRDIWLQIEQGFNNWQQRHQLHEADYFRNKIDQLLTDFSSAVQSVQQELEQQAVTVDPVALEVAISLMGFGSYLDPYPKETWQKLSTLATDIDLHKTENGIRNLTIAWGCGWGRTVNGTAEGWHGRWPNAVFALLALLESSINSTLWKIEKVVDHLSDYVRTLIDQKREISHMMGMEMIHGKCHCGKHQSGCKSTSEGKSCGRECCRTEHHLQSWDPIQLSLFAFIAQAVRGNASSTLLTGALSNSMIAVTMDEEIGLLIANAEFKVCSECNREIVEPARKKHKEPQGKTLVMYEGNRCRKCEAAASRATTYHKFRKNWILIPYERGGTHEMLERWRCRRCRNLYPVIFKACPLCDETPPQRQTAVWVYRSMQERNG